MSDGKGESRAKSGWVHTVLHWLFIGFNVLMAVWMVSYVVSIQGLKATAVTATDKDQLGLAAAVFGGFLLGFWLFGAVLLGLLSSLTKRRTPPAAS